MSTEYKYTAVRKCLNSTTWTSHTWTSSLQLNEYMSELVAMRSYLAAAYTQLYIECQNRVLKIDFEYNPWMFEIQTNDPNFTVAKLSVI